MSSMVGYENVYTCQKCGGRVTTIDVDQGVTPFMIRCRVDTADHEILTTYIPGIAAQVKPNCGGQMHSSFYPLGRRPSSIPAPSFEWYMPDEEEKRGLSQMTLEHVEKGGLLLRRHSLKRGYKQKIREG